MKTFVLLCSLFCSINSFAMSEVSFNKTIDVVIDLYHKELSDIHKNIIINKNWKSDQLNASVTRDDAYLYVNVSGGLIRKYNFGHDTLALIVCHEIGHVLGGFPKVLPTHKYSSEGQADYFATKECFKKYTREVPKKEVDITNLSKQQKNICSNKIDCLRTLVAIQEASKMYYGHFASINKYSRKKVSHTIFNGYPDSQCRVDTLRAGLLCNEKNCKDAYNKRPACWYKSESGFRKYNYDDDYKYHEALIIATIKQTTQTSYGCYIQISDIDYFASGYSSDIDENELRSDGIHVVENCEYFKSDNPISGTITLFKGKHFLNVRREDL